MAIRIGSSPVVPPSSSAPEPEAAKPDAPKPDAFNAKGQPNLALLSQGKVPLRTPAQLGSDLSKLMQAAEVPGRFASDVAVAKPDLVEHPALLQREDKAQRLFDFAVPYAQKAVELKATPEVMNQLLQQAQATGFNELRSGDKNGVDALRELLKEPADKIGDVASAMKFDAPTWPQVPRPIVPKTEIDKPRDEVPERTTNKVLGRNMLWNVMHLFRDDGQGGRQSAEQREALAQLAWVVGLIMVFLAIVAIALVAF